jgi:hypothetical protein
LTPTIRSPVSAFGPARRVNGVRIDLDLIRQQRCTGCANLAPTVLLNRSLECLERREDSAGIMPRAPLQTAATKPAATAEDRRPAPSVRALVSGSPAPLRRHLPSPIARVHFVSAGSCRSFNATNQQGEVAASSLKPHKWFANIVCDERLPGVGCGYRPRFDGGGHGLNSVDRSEQGLVSPGTAATGLVVRGRP